MMTAGVRGRSPRKNPICIVSSLSFLRFWTITHCRNLGTSLFVFTFCELKNQYIFQLHDAIV